MKQQYNGWTNYETWCVHLWLTNDEGSYRYWREQAMVQRTAARRDPRVESGDWELEQAAYIWLGEQLCDEVSEHGLLSTASLYADLLSAALAAVEWQEIAAAMLDELPPDPLVSASIAPTATVTESEAVGTPLFPQGRIVATPGTLGLLTPHEMAQSLQRHLQGDWGLVCDADRLENEISLQEGFRLMSVYETEQGERYWIITEADRSVTTFLLPSEY